MGHYLSLQPGAIRQHRRDIQVQPYLEHYMDWAAPFSREVDGKISHVEGLLYHLWHGHLENRNYANRYRELANSTSSYRISLSALMAPGIKTKAGA